AFRPVVSGTRRGARCMVPRLPTEPDPRGTAQRADDPILIEPQETIGSSCGPPTSRPRVPLPPPPARPWTHELRHVRLRGVTAHRGGGLLGPAASRAPLVAAGREPVLLRHLEPG